MNRKRTIKLLSAVTLGAISPISSLILANNNFDTTSFRNEAKKRQLFNTKYYHDEENKNPGVTQERLDDFVRAASDKLQCMLIAQGLEDDDIIANIVGTFKANCYRDIDNVDDNDLALNAKLTNAKIEAKKLGIDILDFDELNNSIRTNLTNSFTQQLKLTKKYSESEINSMVENLDATIVNLSNEGQENLWGDYDFHMALSETVGHLFNKDPKTGEELSPDEIDENIRQSKLQYVLNQAKAFLRDGIITIGSDGTSFDSYVISRIAEYTNNNIGWKEGDSLQYYVDELGNRVNSVNDADHICYDDLASILTYQYSNLFGTDFVGDYGFWIDEDIPVNTGGEKDSSGEYQYQYPSWLSQLSTTKSLSTFETEHALWDAGEIFPGFALHVKLASIENEQNSHICKIALQIGVSNSAADKASIDKHIDPYVLWDETGDEDNPDDLQPNISFEKEIQVTDIDQIINISKNKYYDLNSFVADVPEDEKPNEIGAYFQSSVDDRTPIDKLIASRENEDGTIDDLSEKPLLLSDGTSLDAMNGIPISSSFSEYWGKMLHTNQTFAFYADGINTQENTLKCFFAIVDKSETNSDQDEYRIVYRIPWSIGGVKLDSLKIQYVVSDELASKISIAQSVDLSLPMITTSSHLFLDNITYEKEILNPITFEYSSVKMTGNVADSYIDYFDFHRAFAITETVVESLMVGTAIAFSVLAFMTGGLGAILLSVMMALIMWVSTVFSIPSIVSNYKYELPKEREWRNSLKVFQDAYSPVRENKIDFSEVERMRDEIVPLDPEHKLEDPTLSYSAKEEISDKILTVVTKYDAYNKESNYQKTMVSFIESIAKAQGEKKEDIQDEINDYLNCWGSLKDGKWYLGGGFEILNELCKISLRISAYYMLHLTIQNVYIKKNIHPYDTAVRNLELAQRVNAEATVLYNEAVANIPNLENNLERLRGIMDANSGDEYDRLVDRYNRLVDECEQARTRNQQASDAYQRARDQYQRVYEENRATLDPLKDEFDLAKAHEIDSLRSEIDSLEQKTGNNFDFNKRDKIQEVVTLWDGNSGIHEYRDADMLHEYMEMYLEKMNEGHLDSRFVRAFNEKLENNPALREAFDAVLPKSSFRGQTYFEEFYPRFTKAYQEMAFESFDRFASIAIPNNQHSIEVQNSFFDEITNPDNLKLKPNGTDELLNQNYIDEFKQRKDEYKNWYPEETKRLNEARLEEANAHLRDAQNGRFHDEATLRAQEAYETEYNREVGPAETEMRRKEAEKNEAQAALDEKNVEFNDANTAKTNMEHEYEDARAQWHSTDESLQNARQTAVHEQDRITDSAREILECTDVMEHTPNDVEEAKIKLKKLEKIGKFVGLMDILLMGIDIECLVWDKIIEFQLPAFEWIPTWI